MYVCTYIFRLGWVIGQCNQSVWAEHVSCRGVSDVWAYVKPTPVRVSRHIRTLYYSRKSDHGSGFQKEAKPARERHFTSMVSSIATPSTCF